MFEQGGWFVPGGCTWYIALQPGICCPQDPLFQAICCAQKTVHFKLTYLVGFKTQFGPNRTSVPETVFFRHVASLWSHSVLIFEIWTAHTYQKIKKGWVPPEIPSPGFVEVYASAFFFFFPQNERRLHECRWQPCWLWVTEKKPTFPRVYFQEQRAERSRCKSIGQWSEEGFLY